MRIALTILLFAYYLLGNSQSYYSENITSRDGLPANAIRSVFEDSRGYLWIGTDAGVSRWDGETFNTYNTFDGFAGNKVWWIDEDKDGNMWFACFGAGISRFNGQYFTSYTSKDGLVDNSVRIVKYSSYHDCLAIGTNKAISVFKDSLFYNFDTDNKSIVKDVIITGIIENDSCIEMYDFSNNHYCIYFVVGVPYIKKNELGGINKYGVSSVFKSQNGNTYFGWSRKGIIKKDNSGLLKIPGIGQVFGIAEDCLGDIWAASWNGGGAISPPGGLFVIADNNPIRLNSAYNINSILGWSAFFKKNQNIVFYGTLDKGLYKIPPRYFEYYPPIFFGENDLSISDVEVGSDNSIWFITDSLLVNWDGNSFEKFILENFYNVKLKHIANSSSSDELKVRISNLKNHYINRNTHFYDIEFDSNDDVWITVERLGFFKIPDRNLDKVIYHSTYVHRDFVFDKADTLFQCDVWSSVLRKFTDFKKSNQFTIYKDSLHPIYSKHLYNYQNEIWACSRISDVFMLKYGELVTITSEDSTINKIVNDICFDTEGYAYLGGSDGRVEILAPETRKKIFEINHEEYENSVHWLKISRDRLFVGYSDGLRVYKVEDIKNKKINCQFLRESEGYLVEIVNSSIVDKEGNIWLATNDGLLKIVTELFIKCQFQPLTTVIQKVEIFNKDVNWEQYGRANLWSGLPLKIPKLNPDQNHISIYFHTLNYNNPNTDLYYYKLDGIDKNWQGPSNKKYVVYPYLNPGKYRFLVKSKNELSNLFTQTEKFEFTIRTPWYKQIWFYILLVTLVIAFFILFYNLRLRNMRKKEEGKRDIMQKISELETKALQAQMNPHFLFNSINSIQSYILDNDTDEALTYLSSFSKIIRMTLEFVDRKFVSLSEVLNYLQHYTQLENMRFDDLFDYTVICDNEIDPETTLIPPMLLQTIIENSIKHGIRQIKHRAHIKLEIAKIDNESFKCIIEDNGVGREKSGQINKGRNINKESLGLKITRERLDILNADKKDLFKMEIFDLYNANNEPSGTRVVITLAFILE